jgi:RHS repeat-associated protein
VRAYGYDGIDRLTSETVTGALSYAKTFAYDAVGNRLTQSTTGAGAGTVHYAYDARDRLTTENATTYAYDPNGNVTSKSGEATYTWDAENRLAAVNLPSGTVAAHQYDADGNRVQTSITPQAAAGTTGCLGNSAAFVREDSTTLGNWQGTYGADGYSINAEAPVAPAYGSVSFSNTNDFTWATNTDDKRALQQPPPQTSRIASTYYSFSGETVHVTTTDNNAHTVAFYMLNWDAPNRNQTITAQTPSGTVLDSARPFAWLSTGIYAVYRICGSVDFVFTPGGAPSAVVSGVFLGPSPGTPANTHMLVDTTGGLSQVVTETDGSGNLTAYYVRIGDELLEVMRPAAGGTWTTRFVHHDGLGSVRALSDETGTTVDTRGYEAFGTKNTEAGNDPLTDGFAGESFERTSQLAYHRARWMDARVGRFEGMDTKDGKTRHPATQHRYVYGLNEPTSVVDPTGNDGVDALPNYAAMVFGIGTAPGSGVNPPLLTPDSGIFEHYHVESNAAAVLQSALNQLAPSFLGYYSGHKVPHGYYATQVPSVSGVTVYLRYIFGQGGITVGNNVTLDRLTWGNIQTSQRYHLLAHELTHVLQYARLDSAIGFLSRYAVEYPSYGVPSELRAKPLSEIDPLDPNYSLDQLADTVADKVNPP